MKYVSIKENKPMLEIEQKFEVTSFQELEKKLASRNVQLAKEEYEVDHYLKLIPTNCLLFRLVVCGGL